MMLLALAAPIAHLATIKVDPSMVQSTPREEVRADDRISRTIYLNRCKGGCTITQGADSATGNTSSILGVGQAHFTEWQYGDDA